jgi:hypothetical protein
MDGTAVVTRGIPEHGGQKSDGLALDHPVVIEIGPDRVDVTGFPLSRSKKYRGISIPFLLRHLATGGQINAMCCV